MSWSRAGLSGRAVCPAPAFRRCVARIRMRLPAALRRTRGGANASDQLAAIRIEPIADRSGQVLYNALRDGLNPLGRPSSPDYRLRIALDNCPKSWRCAPTRPQRASTSP